MDPKGGKNNLSNKLSKKEAIARLKKESFKRITVSFYKYVHITDINFFRNELYNKWFSLNIFGRIYLANEGINCLLYTSPSPRDRNVSRMPSSA